MTWLRQVATYSYQWPLKAVMNQQTQVNKIWEYREPPAAIGKHEVLWAPLLKECINRDSRKFCDINEIKGYPGATDIQ